MGRSTIGGITLPSYQERDAIGKLIDLVNDTSMITHGELIIAVAGGGTTDYTAIQTRARIVRMQGAATAGKVVRFPTAENPRLFVFSNETAVDIVVRTTAEGAGGVTVPAGLRRAVVVVGGVTRDLGGERPVYAARLTNSAAIAVGSASATPLTFNQERRDDGSIHSTASNTERIVIPVSGWGVYYGNVEVQSHATGFRTVSFRYVHAGAPAAPDNIIWAEQANTVAGSDTILASCGANYFTAGEEVAMYLYQNSGVALNVNKSGRYSPEFGLYLFAA